jgi:hypothetical protein
VVGAVEDEGGRGIGGLSRSDSVALVFRFVARDSKRDHQNFECRPLYCFRLFLLPGLHRKYALVYQSLFYVRGRIPSVES